MDLQVRHRFRAPQLIKQATTQSFAHWHLSSMQVGACCRLTSNLKQTAEQGHTITLASDWAYGCGAENATSRCAQSSSEISDPRDLPKLSFRLQSGNRCHRLHQHHMHCDKPRRICEEDLRGAADGSALRMVMNQQAHPHTPVSTLQGLRTQAFSAMDNVGTLQGHCWRCLDSRPRRKEGRKDELYSQH